MKIWCVSKYGSPDVYGPSTKLFNTARSLSKQHDVTLISSNSNPKTTYPMSTDRVNVEKLDNLRHVWINLSNYKRSRSIQRLIGWFLFDYHLSKIADKLKEIPDVIIISSLPITTIGWALKMKRRFGSKVIFEVRDIYPLTMLEMGYSKYNPIIKYMSHLEKNGYSEADAIVGTMSQLSLHVESVLGYKKETFYSPIGLSPLFHYSNDKLEINLPTNKTIVGYVGSLGKANNLNPLIQLIALNQKNQNIHFLIVGDGEYLKTFNSFPSDNLTVTGFVQPKDVYKALNLCDVLFLSVNKSRVLEYGQSMNKIREYLAAGKPIIANYYGYVEEYLKTEGIFYSEHNDVQSMNSILREVSLLDKNTLKSMGEANRNIVKEYYNYEIINGKYSEMISNLFKTEIQD